MGGNLKGGRSTQGVVKIGNTVRRPAKESSLFVSEMLTFLEEKGCPYSQRFIGFDEQGREVYEYIEGVVQTEVGEMTIAQLEEIMRILRTIHDTTAELTENGDVLCHHDASPCNIVFRNGVPVALIDWDKCSFGKRWEDIIFSMWSSINGAPPNSEIIFE
ncbi:hypothetical protein MmiAt1_04700 [Methanimicrococcus sp. At1]|uniref:Aminoglycoside phosphotransferase domain-containing protein n=1 Tax=Methanimicrococcus hacksteinii TaxID=3028293 RepID=A0ABU3VP12_9EURY|nr:phosphotransferase [Methanimicrococcus sp. At1]MDV0444921.1 hypothetical protein [Methanimicrococcus sp. At1]